MSIRSQVTGPGGGWPKTDAMHTNAAQWAAFLRGLAALASAGAKALEQERTPPQLALPDPDVIEGEIVP